MNFIAQVHHGIGFLKEVARGVRSRIFLVSYQRKICAAKLFLPEFSSFAKQEYEVGSTLIHPNINRICKLIEIEGHAGVLMPYIDGKKLSDFYGLEPRAFISLFIELLEGLSYLHGQDIIHRDMKPENVIVVKAQPKLIDFDLAKKASQFDAKKTLVGTIAYFSPEVVRGQPASKASDLYSAAVILYRALTGEVPFIGTLEEVLYAQEHTDPPLASSFSSELLVYDEILKRALAKNPLDRYASADDFAHALRMVMLR